ncbi:hypothetical protein N7520_009462 [Penicillium odoratum]|uniref:uncharacterized protein n=1 Tax=Penicillium odoratum TaxID=1167516 RepID=UPI002546C759|nr:uncharacterized protein N7520_009462 [Penicillium odoratum]KAJ5752545.1 hypothetical protein N7520_009462 [Penicillium odoratum]
MGLVGVFSTQVPSASLMEETYSTSGPYGPDVLHEPEYANVESIMVDRETTPRNGPSHKLIDFTDFSIVFVHGLTRNRESNWTNKQSKAFWPKQLLPCDLPTARIWTFGYDADIIGALRTASLNTLRDHGKSLMHDLSLAPLRLGSTLLCARESPQQHHKDLFKLTFAIAFMGTPHVGSAQANWATPLTRLARVLRRTNTEIVQVLEPGSEMLANLQQGFHTMLEDCRRNQGKTIEMFCFYEELAVPTIGKIFEDHSAILSGCSNRSIHADHMGMTKFSGNRDPGYVAVSGQLWLWVKLLEDMDSQAQTQTQQAASTRTAQQQRAINSGGGPIIFGSVTAGRDIVNSN